jgi:hypothetical protein
MPVAAGGHDRALGGDGRPGRISCNLKGDLAAHCLGRHHARLCIVRIRVRSAGAQNRQPLSCSRRVVVGGICGFGLVLAIRCRSSPNGHADEHRTRGLSPVRGQLAGGFLLPDGRFPRTAPTSGQLSFQPRCFFTS